MKDPIKPVMRVGRTNAQIANQGYTYNQAGLTYNQAGVMYGGLYEHDIIHMVSRARIEKSNIKSAVDYGIPGPGPTQGNSKMLIGILGMLYP